MQKAVIYLTLGLFALGLIFMGVGVPEGFWRPVGVVALVVSLLVAAYDKWIWAWIPRSITSIPDLRGTWRGTLKSSWMNPETGESPPPIEAYFVISQTASKIRVSMMTKESGSSTITAILEADDGRAEVVGVYRNEPRAAVRHRSEIHHGGLRLRVGGPPPTTMIGEYWTDRLTRGDIEIERCSPRCATDFQTAQVICDVHTI